VSEIKPNFAGEMQLAGWTETHNGGAKVTFWLSGPDELAAFRSLTVRKGNQAGHRFMAVLVEVGDDEQPVPPPVIGNPISEKPKGGPLSTEAAAMCRNPEYLNWSGDFNEAEAAVSMKAILGISSRSELDHNERAKEDFIVKFRGPFMRHMLARGKGK